MVKVKDHLSSTVKPRAIPVVAAFLFFATGIALVVGESLLFPNHLLNRLWELNKPAVASFRAMGRISGVALLLLGGGTFATAIGLLGRQPWAWWFAVVLFGVNGIGDVVSFIVTGDWLRSASGVVVALAFLWALSRTEVRRYVRLKVVLPASSSAGTTEISPANR